MPGRPASVATCAYTAGALPSRQAPRPALVVAPRIERVPGEVEVVLPEAVDVVRRRADPDEVAAVPGPAQGHGRLVEEEVDVERLVRLAVAALLGLLDEPDDRRVLLGERLLVGEVGRRGGQQASASRAATPRSASAHAAGLERKMFSGRTSTIPLAHHRGFIPFG